MPSLFTSSQLNDFTYYFSTLFDANNSIQSKTQDSVRYQKILALLKNKQLMNTSQQVNTSSSAIFSSFQHSILTCKFQESACNLTQDFEAFFSSDFSYCFKFNSDTANLKTITMPGALNGFQFSIYLDPACNNNKSQL